MKRHRNWTPLFDHRTLACVRILARSLMLAAACSVACAAESPLLTIERRSSTLELSWPAVRGEPDGSLSRPIFELQQSADLERWRPVGERTRAATASSNTTLGASHSPSETLAFFRLLTLDPPRIARLGQGGAEVFGYGEAFQAHLERIGQITPDEFAAAFPNPAQYLPGISWDPTTALFWQQFNADPEVLNRDKEWGEPGYRYSDTRLNASELAMFRKNGFVVSERLGANSFAEVFYNLWHADLPVFVSCDALLQAWHRTYDAILEEVEETYLFDSLERLLDGMAAQIQGADTQIGNGPLRPSLLDADFFLAVARSLLAGAGDTRMVGDTDEVEVISKIPTVLGQDIRVAVTLADIKAEQLAQVSDFMGFCRVVDFSQFKVRGHYTHTERLSRYFRCMMWLGRIDIPVAGGPWRRCPGDERMASPREIGFAVVLWHLLNASGRFPTWVEMERAISVFVGTTDSLNFAQLAGVLAGAGIRSLADVRDLPTLERLQEDIVRGELGVQNIRSDWFDQSLGEAARYALPQTFTVFGQKFVPDSWALSQTVFSSILWVENGVTNKVPRRVPGALDVAFSVLGNDQVIPELVEQMKGTFADPNRPHAMRFRDGLPYQHNLAAVRAVMDQQSDRTWGRNIYMQWLWCLRALSSPTTGPQFPEALRTRAWAMKTLNTQLASWTHLRHDTNLYAKQSYTSWDSCMYPTGFVEPRLEFWSRLRGMASLAASQIAQLRYIGDYTLRSNVPPLIDATGNVIREGGQLESRVALSEIQQRQITHLRDFATIVNRLEALAVKELAGECFTPEDESFIDTLIEERKTAGCGGPVVYSGWYPRLFYRTIYWFENEKEFQENHGAGAFDTLVADVHTDVPSVLPPDPGSVLHQGVGRANLLMLAVESGEDRFVCAGPVLSHYEFEVIGDPRRLSDSEWHRGGGLFGRGTSDESFPADVPRSRIEGLEPPVWTRAFLTR